MRVVWTTRLDDRYDCSVIEYDDGAKLEIFDDEEKIHEEPVTLSYGALFGPDAGDIYEWQNLILDVIDDE